MMQTRKEQEHRSDEQPFFNTLSTADHQAQQSFSINIAGEQTSTPSTVASLFKNTNNKTSSVVSHDSRLEFPPSPTFRAQSMQNPCQFLQEPSEMSMSQNSLQSSLAQHESETLDIQNQDKMNVLHSRLHQEADKIRRWKVQTEIEIRQKERGLGDAQLTIESQRKSLLELQLQNENLSMRLQEEIENRIEISQKIVSTRDMCNLVKDYAAKLQGKVVDGEQVRVELQEGREKQLADMKLLESNFQELSLAHSNKVNEFKTELHNEKTKLMEAEQIMTAKLTAVEQECGDLQRSCEEKDQAAAVLREDVKKSSRQLALLRQEKEYLQESLNQANEEVEANQQLLAKIKAELKETTNFKNQLRTEQAEIYNKLTSLLEEAEVTKQHMETDRDRIQQLEEQIKAKQSTVAEMDQKLNDLREEKKQLEVNIEEQNKVLIKKKGDVACLKEELKEVLEREKVSYDKLDSMRKDLQSESAENAKLVEVIDFTRKEKHTLEEELLKSKDHAKLLDGEIKKLEEDAIVEKTKLETVLSTKETLEKERDDLETQHQKQCSDAEQLLQQERKQNEDLNEQLEQVRSEKGVLEEKNKSLHGQGGSKSKQIKEIQQEVKTLKGKVTTLTKQKAAAEEGLSDLEKQLDAAKTGKELLEKEAVELRKQTEEAEKERTKAAAAAQEQEMKKFEGALNTYKIGYDKIVAEKDQTINQLKKKLLDETSAKCEQEGRCKALYDEATEMKRKATDAESTRDALQKDCTNQTELIKTLESQVKDKDEEITRLHAEAKEMAEKHLKEEKAAKAQKRRPSPKPSASTPCTIPTTPVTPSTRPRLPDKMKTPLRTPLSGCQIPPESATKSVRTPLTVKAVARHTTPQRSILKQESSIRMKRRVAFAPDKMDDDDGGASSDSSTSQLMDIQMAEVAFMQKEKKQFQELYPELDADEVSGKKKKQSSQSTKNTRKTPKRAYKIKGWGDSPRGRKKKKDAPKDAKENDLSWFENDAVYGFFE